MDRRASKLASSPSTASHFLPPLVGIAMAVVGWMAATDLGGVPSYALPQLSSVLSAAWTERGIFLPAALVTIKEVLCGFLLAVLIGVSLGFAIASYRIVEKGLYPLLVGAQVIPKVAFAPLFIVWFGFDITSKILMSLLLSFFPVVVNTVLGFRSASIESVYLTRAMGASPWNAFRYVRLPNALPIILAGVRLAAGLSVVGAVLGEILGADKGLGQLINAYGTGQDSSVLFASILYVALLGWIFFVIIRLIERHIIFWHVSQRRGRR